MTKVKIDVTRCPLCYDDHKDYTVKTDGNGKRYVICGVMQKKMRVVDSHYWVTNIRSAK